MSDSDKIAAGLLDLAEVLRQTADAVAEIEPIVALMRETLRRGGTLFFAGNGGSAADAQHLAAEYVVRYQAGSQPALRAVALTTDTSALTAAGNDFGFEEVFARQLQALARPGDLLILHSTSGRSPNCLRAAAVAREIGAFTVAFLGGDGGPLRALVDHCFLVRDKRVNHIQEVHLAVQHQIASILTSESGGDREG